MNDRLLNAADWYPGSWRNKPATQQPKYADPEKLQAAINRLSRLPPLVTSWEIESLKQHLASVENGQAFLLQAGDCCESLEDCATEAIVRNLKVLMQMSFVLIYGSLRKIVRVGRFAGQYAKPRSAEFETRDGVTLPVYRGDIVNRSGFTAEEREPDPELLLRGYERAALTLNFVRSLIGGGFADLHHPENWELDFRTNSLRAEAYLEMVHSITRSMQFMETVMSAHFRESYGVEIFSSHEALHLSYEEAQTRKVPRRTGWYNLSTHLPWIGYRTNALDGAHVEYFRGLENPVGVKIGPNTTPEHVRDLCRVLNRDNQPGKVVLIHRFGVDQIDKCLPPIIELVRRVGLRATWSCDPMHGNTYLTDQGIKTRDFSDIYDELVRAFEIHNEVGSGLGGVHLEVTGDNVTECVGGAACLDEIDLQRAYKSPVDPRLNYDQAMELAFLMSEKMSRKR